MASTGNAEKGAYAQAICPGCEPDNPAARYADTCPKHKETDMTDLVQAERARQIAKGYDAAHDDAHSLGDLIALTAQRLGRVMDSTPDESLVLLVQVEAMVVACREKIEREQGR